MDNFKIYDSRLSKGASTNVLAFLDRKYKSLSAGHSTIDSVEGYNIEQKSPRVLPNFSFVFESYTIGEHVEYNVILLEKYKVLTKTITKKYEFKTRYSMLEVLDRKLGEMGLPGKKFFGNKERSFIEKRKVDLEAYLNKVARSGKPEFYRFVKQIKDS